MVFAAFTSTTNIRDKGDRIVEFLLHVLENEESEKVQALLCVGISKLMLSGMITDERVRLYLDYLPFSTEEALGASQLSASVYVAGDR